MWAAVLVGVGCTGMVRAPESERLRPIPVADSMPVGLEPVRFALRPGEFVGGAAPNPQRAYRLVHEWQETLDLDPAEFNFPLRDELTSHGYRFAFPPRVAWRLQPTVTKLVYNLFGSDPRVGWTEASVEVRWELNGPRQLVFTTSGYAQTRPHSLSSIFEAFRQSLRNLLAKPAVATAMSPPNMNPPPGKPIVRPVPVVPNPVNPVDPTTRPVSPTPVPVSPTPVPVAPTGTLIPRPPVSAAPLDDATLLARTRAATVTVIAGDGWATGVVLTKDGLVVTSAAVVTGQRQVTVVTAAGVEKLARVEKVHTPSGLALVKAHGRDYRALRLESERVPASGGEVMIVGTPFHPALSFAVSRGRLTAANGSQITTDARVSVGNAGGPIVDARGRVLGIVRWEEPRGTESAPALGIAASSALRALGLTYGD